MPILNLQRRMRQLGEIRIGHVVDTGKTNKEGKPIKRPSKLNKFRFTSPSRPILDEVATLYGGTVQPWTPANDGPTEWEVYSTFDRLPILIPPRNAVSQWYELYAGSRCIRRCDGEVEQKSDQVCMCNPDKRQCAITTRINVMLRDVPALGQWLLVSKGYYAATTLPDAAELLALVGGYVPGWLGMEEKVVHKDDGPPNRFMVPTIDVDITPSELMAGQISAVGKAAIEAPDRPAIEAAPAAAPVNYASLASRARDPETVRKLYRQANAAGHMTKELEATLGARVAALTPKAAVPAPGPTQAPEPEDGIHDVEVLEDDPVTGDPTELWGLIVMAAGRLGWTTEKTQSEFASANSGTLPGSAEASELRAFLADVKARR